MFGDLENAQGETLDYSWHPGDSGSSRLALIGHGVTGNKDRPFLHALANALSSAGIPALRFSFSGNGQSEGRFTDSTISKEVADLESILDRTADREVAYVGHSMGGAVGVILAAKDPRIRYLVTLAGMVYPAKFAQTEFGEVTPGQGYMWDDDNCPLSQSFMNDLTAIETTLDHAGRITAPWLLVHGDRDDVVPFQDSEDIRAKTRDRVKLISLPGADHVFSEPHTEAMTRATVAWLQTQFENRSPAV